MTFIKLIFFKIKLKIYIYYEIYEIHVKSHNINNNVIIIIKIY